MSDILPFVCVAVAILLVLVLAIWLARFILRHLPALFFIGGLAFLAVAEITKGHITAPSGIAAGICLVAALLLFRRKRKAVASVAVSRKPPEPATARSILELCKSIRKIRKSDENRMLECIHRHMHSSRYADWSLSTNGMYWEDASDRQIGFL